MKKFLFIATSLIFLSATSNRTHASPVIEKQYVVTDVGFCPAMDIVVMFQNDAVASVEQPAPIAEGIMPVTLQYQKKKFVTFNKKLNRHRQQLYGIRWDKDKQRILSTANEVPDLPDISEIKECVTWAWNTKTKMDT